MIIHAAMIIHAFIWHPMLKTIAIVSYDCDGDTGWSNYFHITRDAPQQTIIIKYFEHQILLQPNISGLKRIFITSSIFTRIIPTFGICIPTRMRQKQGLNFYN